MLHCMPSVLTNRIVSAVCKFWNAICRTRARAAAASRYQPLLSCVQLWSLQMPVSGSQTCLHCLRQSLQQWASVTSKWRHRRCAQQSNWCMCSDPSSKHTSPKPIRYAVCYISLVEWPITMSCMVQLWFIPKQSRRNFSKLHRCVVNVSLVASLDLQTLASYCYTTGTQSWWSAAYSLAFIPWWTVTNFAFGGCTGSQPVLYTGPRKS